MNRTILFLSFLWLLPTVMRADDKPKAAPSDVELKTQQDRVSYGIGRSIGDNIKSDGLEVDVKMLARGITDALAGLESPQTMEEFEAAFLAMRKELQAQVVVKNKKFLEENGKKEGVKTTESGLQYQVLRAGKGKKPTATDSVKAHYHGTFINGKVFDSSVDREEPAVFPLNRVIPGWTEGLQLMQVGAKYRFWIPSDLAYGPDGRPGIAANSVLVFEVELLDVIAAEEPTGPPKKAGDAPKKPAVPPKK
jgi:FKBP-type peptidyl-prolyl cis-trans isomerase